MTIRGGAWVSSWTAPNLTKHFGIKKFFNGATHRQAALWELGGIPVARTPGNRQGGVAHAYWRVLPKLVAKGYKGPVKLFNEPELHGQDNTSFVNIKSQYYAACNFVRGTGIWFVVGNYVFHDRFGTGGIKTHTGDTLTFAKNIKLRPQDVLGIHYYPIGNTPPIQTLTEKIITTTPVTRLWVTEYGLDNRKTAKELKTLVAAVEGAPGVDAAFAYTVDSLRHGGIYGTYQDRHSLRLTSSGWALWQHNN